MREKKAIVCTLISFVCMAVLSPAALAATETFHETYDVTSGTPLTVSNRNGGITVRVWENETVDVIAAEITATMDSHELSVHPPPVRQLALQGAIDFAGLGGHIAVSLDHGAQGHLSAAGKYADSALAGVADDFAEG